MIATHTPEIDVLCARGTMLSCELSGDLGNNLCETFSKSLAACNLSLVTRFF